MYVSIKRSRKCTYVQHTICILLLLMIILCTYSPALAAGSTLDEIIADAAKRTKTPGIAVVVVNEQDVETFCSGYADVAKGMVVDEDTLFELGSVSKAFTALGILKLEQQGALSLSDDIRTYIPWLSFSYSGEYEGKRIREEGVSLSIEQLLHHTSGLPFEAIGYIPQGDGDTALEDTVKAISGIRLKYYPGVRYSYSTANYDILGLIIQIISGQSYESYIEQEILHPLGLENTYVIMKKARSTGLLAQGYKLSFLSPIAYEPPAYRGNTPAGYIVSSINDIARWMQIQMGLVDVPEPFKGLIKKSHMGDSTVSAIDDSYYAAGWSTHIRGKWIEHGGSNPTFSTYILIDPTENIAIGVLANLNGNAPGYIAHSYFAGRSGRPLPEFERDIYQNMDILFSILCFVASAIALVYLIALGKGIFERINGCRDYAAQSKGKVARVTLAIPILIFFGFCIYYLPNILFSRLSWETIAVWGSRGIVIGSGAAFAAGVMLMIYTLFTFNFPQKNEKNYLALIPLSIINGLMSAIIIFTINESFNLDLEYSRELIVYFIFALVTLVYTMKLTQSQLIIITNEITYEKRMKIIDQCMRSSYRTIEQIGSARIHACLNNDTEAIARLPSIIVSLISGALTIVFCLAYLLSNSVMAFGASLAVIVLNCGLGFLTGRIATRYWEKNRDIQDVFFSQIADLVNGFKELVLSKAKKGAFEKDIKNYSRLSVELSKEASIKFLNFEIYNQLMYNMIFGIVVFLFPLFLIGIQVNDLRETLFMVFYLIGPFGQIMQGIPQITQIRVNITRINRLIDELEIASSADSQGYLPERVFPQLEKTQILFEDIEYYYEIVGDDATGHQVDFNLGPLSLTIQTGTILCIAGGNGSGKSTLGKIMTGLYEPQKGTCKINGQICDKWMLNEYFSAVFSDYYMFSKLYGVDTKQRWNEITDLLHTMQLTDKVLIDEDGKMNGQNLSSGQKKRLAYIVCRLEDKPFILFDEWAAEQDPEFRCYFYEELLPALREAGKGIVIISHDDRYYHIADQIVKLERGTIQ